MQNSDGLEDAIVDDFEPFFSSLPENDEVPLAADVADAAQLPSCTKPDVLNIYIRAASSKLVNKSMIDRMQHSSAINTVGSSVGQSEQWTASLNDATSPSSRSSPLYYVDTHWTVGGFGIWYGENDSRNVCHVEPSLSVTHNRMELQAFVRAVIQCITTPNPIVFHLIGKTQMESHLKKLAKLSAESWMSFCDTDNVDLIQQLQAATLQRQILKLPEFNFQYCTSEDLKSNASHPMHHAQSLARRAADAAKQRAQQLIIYEALSLPNHATSSQTSHHAFTSDHILDNDSDDDNLYNDNESDNHSDDELGAMFKPTSARAAAKSLSKTAAAASASSTTKTRGGESKPNQRKKQPTLTEVQMRAASSSHRLFPFVMVKPKAKRGKKSTR